MLYTDVFYFIAQERAVALLCVLAVIENVCTYFITEYEFFNQAPRNLVHILKTILHCTGLIHVRVS